MKLKEFRELTNDDIIEIAKYYADYFNATTDADIVTAYSHLDEIDKNILCLFIAVGRRYNRLAAFLMVDAKKIKNKIEEIRRKIKINL